MLVSICMATYNGGRHIRQQLDSILNQEFVENPDTKMEIIISDDGSKDDTLDIVRSYNDDRIKIYHHSYTKKHRYFHGTYACAANFGHAVSKATGDYIFLSDQDDVWYPWKVDEQLTVLKKHGGLCASAFDMGDMNLKYMGRVAYEVLPFFFLRNRNPIYGFSIAIDREELKYLFPFPEIHTHDGFFFYTARWRNNVHYVSRPSAMHRWSGNHNTSAHNDAPLIVKILLRIRMWAIIIFRSMVRK